MVEEDWSFERFSLGPEMRNFYCQFLYGFPLEYFAFVGITEFYDADHAFFSERFLNASFPVERLNSGGATGDEPAIDASMREAIEKYHEKDMELYRRALALRRARCLSSAMG